MDNGLNKAQRQYDMQSPGPDMWADACRERLNQEWGEHMTEESMWDFISFVADSKHFNELWSGWLKSPDGERWYASALDKLVRNAPENDEDWRADR